MKRFLTLLTLLPSIAFAAPAQTIFVSATPTVDTAAYATGELIGGKLTFTAALPSNTGSGMVVSVTVVDKEAQAQDLELWLFRTDPTGTTFTDQAAFDLADADLSKVLAVVSLGSATRFNLADNGVKYIGSLALPVEAGSNAVATTLYGALVSRGSPDWASASDVTVILGIVGD